METKNFNLLDKFIAKMRLARVLPFVDKQDTILDFGCGYQAFFLHHVHKKIKRGVGVDYEVNSTVSNGNIELINFNFTSKLPFEDNSFDKIFLLAVFEHIPLDQTKSLLLELKRILKKEGKIILTIPTPKGKPILEFLAFRLNIISRPEIEDHKKYYAKEDILQEANQAGLALIYHSYFQFGWNSIQVLQKN